MIINKEQSKYIDGNDANFEQERKLEEMWMEMRKQCKKNKTRK